MSRVSLVYPNARTTLRELTPVIRPYDRCHYHVPPGHTRVTAESGHTRGNVTPGIRLIGSKTVSLRPEIRVPVQSLPSPKLSTYCTCTYCTSRIIRTVSAVIPAHSCEFELNNSECDRVTIFTVVLANIARGYHGGSFFDKICYQ